MEALHADPGLPLEPWTEGGLDACFQLATPSSTINGLRLADATAALREALADLPAFRDRVEHGIRSLRAMGVEPADTFSLVLDNEPPEESLSAASAVAGTCCRRAVPSTRSWSAARSTGRASPTSRTSARR